MAAAFALGAIVSPPDAVAVEAILKRLRVPVSIEAVLSGESLVNDATALVAYQFAIAAMVTGEFSFRRGEPSFYLRRARRVGTWFGCRNHHFARFQRRLDDPPFRLRFRF